MSTWSLHFAAEHAITVLFQDNDPMRANQQAALLALHLHEAKLSGVQAVVPGMVAVTLYIELAYWAARYQPQQLSELAFWQEQLQPYLDALTTMTTQTVGRQWQIPVCYEGECAPDLEAVARHCGLATDEVIALHSHAPVTVMMLGFAPGHPYLGRLDARLDIARRSTPRTSVPVGSVAIANRQSVIYSMPSPGGWHLIGRTPTALFDLQRDEPVLLTAGDQVQFHPISYADYQALVAKPQML